MKLSEKIIMCRKRACLSQDALAELIGVSRQAVSKWETGEALPETSKLSRLAEVFHVSIDWLLSDSDESYLEVTPPAPQKQAVEVPENLPKFLTRIFRKYGWLTGLYLIIGGAAFAGLGVLARVLTRKMFSFDPFNTGDMSSSLSISYISAPMDIMTKVVIVLGVVLVIAGVVAAIALRKWGKKK